MNNIYKAYNPLKHETYWYIALLGVFWLISFGILVLFETLQIFQYYGMGYLIFIAIISGVAGKKIKINLNGLRGETIALRSVRQLGSDYAIFLNTTIEYEGLTSEIDIIAVGAKGVFVCEVKNHNGEIIGKADDKRWIQIKSTKRGGRFYNGFYNPTKQVKTHTYRLSQVLKESGYNGWVQASVYFVNPNAQIKANGGKIPIIGPQSSLKTFIDNYHPKRMLNEEEINLIQGTILTKMESIRDKNKRTLLK